MTALSEPDVYAGLTEIFRDVFDDPDIVPRPEMSAADVPEWDSFNHVNLVVAAELRFGVKFRPGEIEGLRNVGDFAQLIRAKAA